MRTIVIILSCLKDSPEVIRLILREYYDADSSCKLQRVGCFKGQLQFRVQPQHGQPSHLIHEHRLNASQTFGDYSDYHTQDAKRDYAAAQVQT